MCCFREPNWRCVCFGAGKADTNAGMLKAASHDNGGPTMTARTMVADKVPPVLKPVRDASLMRRQNVVAGEWSLREIAGATRRRVAR
jgi:hypothetical protein